VWKEKHIIKTDKNTVLFAHQFCKDIAKAVKETSMCCVPRALPYGFRDKIYWHGLLTKLGNVCWLFSGQEISSYGIYEGKSSKTNTFLWYHNRGYTIYCTNGLE
jgi:hypothetical protein